GDAGSEEIRAIGERLVHRGNRVCEWSVGPLLRFGMRSSAGALERLTGGAITYDGIIDNRDELTEEHHRGFSPLDDAATVLELFHRDGIEAFARIAGQFAVAISASNRRLILARDRIGYAPLYFTLDNDRFLFASEYKALLAIPSVPARPNRDAIQVIQSTKWVMPGATCLAGIYPVAPGTWVEVDVERIHTARFWNIPIQVAHEDESKHVGALRNSFIETLRKQVEPYSRVGISLSGGLDSAVMAAGVRHVAGDREVHTFSAGYGPDDRELVNAEMVAKEVGTIHHPLVLDPSDLPNLLPWMVWHLEEPIGREDIAYLFIAAREAARHVELILTGFGFDGLFAGLPRHRLVDLGMRLPLMRKPLEEFYDFTFRSVEPHSVRGRALRSAYFRGKDYPVPEVIGASPLPDFQGFPRGGEQPLSNFLRNGFLVNPYQSPVERLYAGAGVRMNAHHTDPSFLAAAFSIPDSLKIHGRTQKYILRKACAGLLPESVLKFGKSFNRLKHNLALSAVLDGMADDLLAPGTVRERGLFEPSFIAALRARPADKPYSQERGYRLWSLLLMEMWSRMYLDARGAPPLRFLGPVRRLSGQGQPTPAR
ncbi:MAG TPA: asparagine synthase-related protein, partial [Gemmatimonadales bacterium]|nr:asparagine synthase-related protein [Gemmatimonadales bacterium]